MFIIRFFIRLFFRIRLFVSTRLWSKKGIYYINGQETLPKPLSSDEEEKIISMLDINPALRAVLVERNLRLVVYIAKKFENTGVGIEDLISIGTIGLIKAINTFKTDKNIKLATYASRCIENEILMHIRKTANHRCEVSIDEPLNVDWDGNELLLSDILGCDEDDISKNVEYDEEKRMVRNAVSMLEPRERVIIELRFGLRGGDEKTQKEVADMLGISQSYISRLEKKIMSELRNTIGARI